MITVTLYYQAQSPESDQALADLKALQETLPHQLVQIQADQNPALLEKIGGILPYVEIGPYRLRPPFTKQDLQIMISAARDRAGQLEQVDQENYQERLQKGHSVSNGDRFTRFLGYHYLAVVNILLFIYVGLPFLAPVLMKDGSPGSANLIYRIYSPMCHQLAFRSFFLFGEQPFYPRTLAGVADVIPYEKIANSTQIDILAARNFLGNQTVGFKVALCERDIAIYLFMLLFGLIYSTTGRRLRSIPWYIWVTVGLVPIGLDGFSQLPSLMGPLPEWLSALPIRESTPFLRVLTGGLFGWMTAWYLFPLLNQTAMEARMLVEHKQAVVQQSQLSGQG